MLTVKKKIIWKRALLESGLIEKYKYTRGGSSWVRGGQLTESIIDEYNIHEMSLHASNQTKTLLPTSQIYQVVNKRIGRDGVIIIICLYNIIVFASFFLTG